MSGQEDDAGFTVPPAEAEEQQPQPEDPAADLQEQSSEESALTDEEEERLRELQDQKETERLQKEVQDRDSQQNLSRLFLNASKKKHLYLIKTAEVNDSLARFWDVLQKDSSAHAQLAAVSSCFDLVLKLLLAGFSEERVKELSGELLGAAKMRETAHFTQEEFFEALLSLADVFVEDLDVQTAATLLDFLFNRLTQRVVIQTDGSTHLVQQTLSAKFYHTPTLNKTFKIELHFEQQPDNVVYCLEKFEDLDSAPRDPRDSQVTELKAFDQVVPLGSLANLVVESLKNERPLPASLRVQGHQELSMLLSKNEATFFVGFTVEDTDGRVIRLSPSLFCPYHFEQLQTKQGAKVQVNRRSIHPQTVEFDPVHEMTKRWNEKSEVPRPADFEVWDKAPEDLFLTLVSNKHRLNRRSTHDDDKYRELDFKSSDTFPTIKSEKFANFLTREKTLPADNRDPYSQDLLEFANERPFHILVHGKPKIGKTKFCQSLAKKLDLELVDLDLFVGSFMKRVQEGEENPQNDDDGNPIEFLKPYERQMITDLRQGRRILHDNLLSLMKDEIQRLRIEQKGCVMEMNCFDNPTNQLNFSKLIVEGKLIVNSLDPTFNVIIELYVEDDNLLHRTRQIRENLNLQNFTTVSDGELANPPVKEENPDNDQSNDAQDIDPDDPSIIKPENLYYRVNESDVIVHRGLANYKSAVRPVIEEMEKKVHHLNNIFLDYDTLTIAQAVDTVFGRLYPRSKYLRPVASILDEIGEEDYASLTKASIKSDEGEFMRRWTPFYKHDPVALFNKKVQRGLSQFSCDYAGRIFCFASEQNRNEFYRDPKKYLLSPPRLPSQYNISLIGMKNTGKRLFAEKLAEKYGLEIVDLPTLVARKYQEQAAWENHLPNSPETGLVYFSKNEFNELKKGNPFDAKLALPFLLADKQIPLYKRPPPPKDPDQPDDDQAKKDEEERLKREEAKKKKEKKKEDKNAEPEKPPAVFVEDVALADIVPKPSEKGELPEPKGWIFLDFPISEAQVAAMKDMNITLDRVVLLKEPDTNAAGEPEEPGAVISKRPDFFTHTTLADEQQFMEAATAAVKAGLEEDRIAEITSADPDITFFKIRQFVDPFCPRIDDDSTALPVEETEVADRVLFGEYGAYCPVTAHDEKWLVLGKPEIEVQVRGKRYRFYNEDCKKKFEDSLEKYLVDPQTDSPAPPEPRIFMTGCSGSGLKTHVKRLHSKLRVAVVNYREEFKKVFDFKKSTRREHRRLLKGFNAAMDENGVPIIPDDSKEPELDPEIENDPDDFDNTKNEQDISNTILSKLSAAIINCRMDTEKPLPPLFPVEEEPLDDDADADADQKKDSRPAAAPKDDTPEEEILKQPFVDLLSETKKLPEIIIILTVSEAEMLKRKFNKKRLQDEYDARIAYIETRKEKARKKKIRELEIERKTRKDEGGEGADEIDLSVPIELEPDSLDGIYQAANIPEEPDLNKMIEEEKERLLNKLKEETTKLDELVEALSVLKINVVKFEANKDIEKVFKKITHEISKVIEDREALYSRQQVVRVIETDSLTSEKVLEWALKSYSIKESRFGLCNALQPDRAIQSVQHPLIFNNRVYYFSSAEEREAAARNPLKSLATFPVAPKDVPLRPKVVLLGRYKSGKSTIARKAAEVLGLVYVTIEDVQELFVKNKWYGRGKELFDTLAAGGVPKDELIVELLALRLRFSDCIQKGFILEGFPQSKRQAILMYKNKIIPEIVVNQNIEDWRVKARALDPALNKSDPFEFDEEILNLRLVTQNEELKAAENLYTYNFGNIRQLNKESTDSKVAELAAMLEQFIKGRQAASIGINLDIPFDATRLSIKKSTIMSHICPALTFSSVSIKKFGAFEQMFLRADPLIYYKNNFYLLRDQEQVDSFVKSPELFIHSKVKPELVAIQPTAEEIISKDSELRQFCPVELFSKKLVKGKKHLSLIAFGKLFSFSSVKAMRIFYKNPTAFSHLKLPEKIRVPPAVGLLEKAKPADKGDLQTFIHNELSRLIVKALNQASKFRLKYPTLSVNSTALKLVALCLKSSNPHQTEEIRDKYKQKMKAFISDCLLAEQVLTEFRSRGTRRSADLKTKTPETAQEWGAFHEEHFLRLAEEFESLMRKVKIRNPQDYFTQFIR